MNDKTEPGPSPHNILVAALSGLDGNRELTFGRRATFLLDELRRCGYEIVERKAST
jgi:hypothetical protein